MTLRDYQRDAIQRARAAFLNGFKAVCLVLPCRSGKSVLAAYIAKSNTDKKRRVLFLVHRIELCEQITDTFVRCGVDMNYCSVEMVQTVTNHTDEIEPPYIIITDEAHHSLCKTYRRIYDMFPAAYKIYFTATPVRLDGRGLDEICDTLVVGTTCEWLQKHAYLSYYDYFAPTLADFSDCRKARGDFVKTEVHNRMSSKKIYGDVIKHYKEICNGKKAIAYCASVEHSKTMCEEFNNNGIPAAHIDSKTPKNERKMIMDAFRQGDILILCNYEIVGEGLDVPDCEVCLLLRATASLTLFVQMACRCLTYYKGKKAIILDFVGNYTRFGMPTQDREWSLKGGYKKERQSNEDGTLKIRVCKNCYGTFETAPVCPYCGTPYTIPKQEVEQIKEAKLKKIEQRKAEQMQRFRERTQNEMKNVDDIMACKSLFEMCAWCKAHGKKQGYAYIMAKRKGII